MPADRQRASGPPPDPAVDRPQGCPTRSSCRLAKVAKGAAVGSGLLETARDRKEPRFMARARDKRYGCLRRRSCENSAGRGLFRSLVRIDHIARLVLGRHKHDLGRDVLDLAEIVTLDMLELELQHARLRPRA